MNKFITTDNGGLPFVLDDIRFEQDAVREAFLGLVSGFGISNTDSFIISGCGVTTTATYDIAAGYFCINGEICKVDAHSVVIALGVGADHYWAIDTSFDPAGNKTFQSASVFDTYQIRKAKVINGVPPGTYTPMLADTIFTKIKNGVDPLLSYSTEWTNLIFNAGDYVIGGGAGTVTGGNVRYKLNGKTLMLAFNITMSVTLAGTIFLNAPLPTGLSIKNGNPQILSTYTLQQNTVNSVGNLSLTAVNTKYSLHKIDPLDDFDTGTLTFRGMFVCEVN